MQKEGDRNGGEERGNVLPEMFPRLGTLLRWILRISSWILWLQELGVDVVVVGLTNS